METLLLDNDINVFYVTANSFPDGILAAHQKLHSLIQFSKNRKYLGISRPENGAIVYRAAAEELTAGEAEKLNCEKLVLKKGKYNYITVNNYLKDLPAIDRSFKELLSNPNIDPEGYCVEWYFNDNDVKCMVRLKD